MQLLRLLPQLTRFGTEAFFGSRDHAEEELGFFGFLATGSDLVSKIPFGNGIIGLAVVRAHTGASANQLINQPVVDRILRYLLCKLDYGLAKPRGTLFQVVLQRFFRTVSVAVPQYHKLRLFLRLVPGIR